MTLKSSENIMNKRMREEGEERERRSKKEGSGRRGGKGQ